ncbi:MAG: CNNM domain-containing protein, partial [Nitrospinales bacterium]
MAFIVTLILVFICIALEAFFSGAEIALISANRIKVQHRAKNKDKDCQAVNELWETPDRTFAMTSLGTNLAMVSCTAIFTAYMVAHFGEIGDLLAMAILTPLILMAGEIIPKMVFQNAADQMILSIIKPLKFFQNLLSPAVSFITAFSDQFLKKVLRQTETSSFNLNREQIRQIIHPQTPTELDSAERKMIHKIFNFGEIAVEQCMVPLVQIHSIRDI